MSNEYYRLLVETKWVKKQWKAGPLQSVMSERERERERARERERERKRERERGREKEGASKQEA